MRISGLFWILHELCGEYEKVRHITQCLPHHHHHHHHHRMHNWSIHEGEVSRKAASFRLQVESTTLSPILPLLSLGGAKLPPDMIRHLCEDLISNQANLLEMRKLWEHLLKKIIICMWSLKTCRESASICVSIMSTCVFTPDNWYKERDPGKKKTNRA